MLGAPAANPSSPSAGSRRLCWSDNPHPQPGPGIRSVPAAARQLPTHTTHTLAHTHTHTHTNPLGQGSARSPQQIARLERGRRSGQWESGRCRFQQPDSCRKSTPPRRPKNKVNFKVMQIVMQRFFPTLRLKKKKNAFHNWRRKTKIKKKKNLRMKPSVLSVCLSVQGRSERRSARSKAEKSR